MNFYNYGNSPFSCIFAKNHFNSESSKITSNLLETLQFFPSKHHLLGRCSPSIIFDFNLIIFLLIFRKHMYVIKFKLFFLFTLGIASIHFIHLPKNNGHPNCESMSKHKLTNFQSDLVSLLHC